MTLDVVTGELLCVASPDQTSSYQNFDFVTSPEKALTIGDLFFSFVILNKKRTVKDYKYRDGYLRVNCT